jgi:heme a synthase
MTGQAWPAAQADTGDVHRALRAMLAALLVLVLATNLLSAWLRHVEAGIGCAPWPECYAQIDPASETLSEKPVSDALHPSQGIKRLHRTIATVLVLLVLLVIHQSRRHPHPDAFAAMLPYALGAVTLLLAVVGPASYLKTRPGIAATNLLGGMLMLAVTWRMWLGLGKQASTRIAAVPRRLVLAALAAVSLQIALGAWTSANFAGTVCEHALGCAAPAGGGFSPAAFWYLRELPVDALGHAASDADTWLIQHAHRAGAWLTAGLSAVLGLVLLKRRTSAIRGVLLIGLVAIQLVLGMTLVARALPMAAVLAHLLLATLLLLTLIDLAYRSRPHERS